MRLPSISMISKRIPSDSKLSPVAGMRPIFERTYPPRVRNLPDSSSESLARPRSSLNSMSSIPSCQSRPRAELHNFVVVSGRHVAYNGLHTSFSVTNPFTVPYSPTTRTMSAPPSSFQRPGWQVSGTNIGSEGCPRYREFRRSGTGAADPWHANTSTWSSSPVHT